MKEKDDFIAILKQLRLHQCAYAAPDGRQPPMCDCKFSRGGKLTWKSENNNGCPELLWCIQLIESLNEKQLENFLDHGTLVKRQRIKYRTNEAP